MKLLLAIDSSKGSQTAVDEVAARPWPAGSTAEVISVVEPAHLWTMSITSEEAGRRAKEVVERAARQLSSSGLPAVGVVAGGDPKTLILDRLTGMRADLAVVGSHGVSAVTRFLLGNVAASVARQVHTCWPSRTQGRSDFTRMSARSCASSGSPAERVEAR